MLLSVHEPGGEPLFVQVTLPPVPEVEALRIEAIESVHAERQALARRLDEEVIVRPHQAPRVKSPAEHLDDLGEQHPECFPVVVVDVDVRAADAARRYVEEAVLWKTAARSAWHCVDGSSTDGS
jgi:hypothetical protein